MSAMRRIVGRAIAYVVLLLIGLVGIAPFLYLLVLSFKRRIDIISEVPPTLHFDWAAIQANYNEIINYQGILTSLVNSVIVVGIATFLALVIGTPAAYAFSRLQFRGRDTWASTILSFRFMPAVAVAVPIYLLMKAIGLTDTYPGLILPYVAFSIPLVVWILIGFFDEIPTDLDDAARVDGCSRFQVLTRIMLPIMRPGLVVAAMFGAIFIWNEFLVALFVINSPEHSTITLTAATLVSAQRPIDWNIAAATGVVTVIPILLFSFVVQKYIVRGITSGAVR
jgi:multiple sugar transport system permease protein